MAFQTGSATGINDLLTKLFTFASANGWVIDKAVTGTDGYLHRNNIYMGLPYSASAINMYQARGYTSSSPETLPGNHPTSLAPNGSPMVVSELSGAFDSYWFFESDVYLHVVVEVSDKLFRHFGFGEIEKIGAWTGGEYSYGHLWGQGSTVISAMGNTGHKPPFDPPFAGGGTAEKNNSLAIYGTKTSGAALPGGGTSSPIIKWYRAAYQAVNDGDGVPCGQLLPGGWRNTPYAHMLSIGASDLNGFQALAPIPLFINDTSTTPDVDYLMGHIPDIRLVNVGALNIGQEYTIGGETWIPFPMGR